MIKIILEIQENKDIKLKDLVAIDTTVSVSEEYIKPTVNEIKVKEILEKKLELNKKVQFNNRSKYNDEQIKNIEEIVNSLFSI